MLSPDGGIRGPTIERRIGGTTYIVTSTYSKNAAETAVQKIRRAILKDADKVLKKSNNC